MNRHNPTRRTADPATLDPSRSLLTVEEAAAVLRIGRNMCYELIRQGQIPHVRLGRLIRVPRFGLESWIAQQSGLPAEAAAVISFSPQRH
jgi:excisionase family DNA binding protein